ncbi:Solute carrier family 35 member C2 [Trichoplax sp. H2]|nr:Solute carrier family 35 member C2 [Trichoplax sp. H2]|eukprot:RDD47281.1 Solute carrier family 35 member C2 [Trichoplax sp. H2]
MIKEPFGYRGNHIFEESHPQKASQISVVALVSGGLLLFTYQSTDFNLFGFILVLSASFIGGLRWALAQTILQKESVGLANPIDLMFHLQPIMAITLLPLAVFIEGPSLALSSQVFRAANLGDALWTLFLILIGAILGFLLSLSEYFVVLQTSGLTLSISGIFKEICTLSIAFTLGGDKINLINFMGLVVCIAGISLHVYMKAQAVLKKNTAKDYNYQRVETI